MSTRLSGFLLLSLAAHVLIIGLLHAPSFSQHADRNLDVVLASTGVTARSVAARSPWSAVRSGAAHVATDTRESIRPETAPVAASGDTGNAPVSRAVPHPGPPDVQMHPNAQSGLPGQRMVRLILDALVPYFRYPLLAREEGWQGRVTIRLRIGPHGRLSRMRIADSSGYTVLDQAALRSMEQVSRLPPDTFALGGTPFDVLVPIVYRLTDS